MSLQLVAFDPNDYKLGEVLSTKAGETITSSEKISAVFSLYFQWPDEARAFAYFDLPGRPSFSVKLDYDRDERYLTQIVAELPEGVTLAGIDKAFIRIEVFNGCFEFETNILEIFTDKNQCIIVESPTSVRSLSIRRSGRINVTSKEPLKLYNGDKSQIAELVSITLNGIVVKHADKTFRASTFEANNQAFEIKFSREAEEGNAYSVSFANDIQAWKYFELYRKFAYPHLVPRDSVDLRELYRLFEKAGFFGNFAGKFDEPERPEKAVKCWSDISEGQHEVSADYVIQDDDGLVGASSCALAMKDDQKEFWVFHQLCADKEKGSLDLTSDLYSWRAEYLWNRKSDIKSVFWFRSQSRWLERIYVKFAMQNPSRGKVGSARLFAYIHHSENLKVPPSKLEAYGPEKRAYYSSEGVVGGLGPDYVHINRNMNLIQGAQNWDSAFKAAESMCQGLSRKSAYFRVVMPDDIDLPQIPQELWEPQTSVDRHAEIDKEGMLDFITCLKHSIAVTKKKNSKAG